LSVEVECPCTHAFRVPDDLAGGYANCPRCQQAVAVPGLRDPLWRALQGLALLLWAGGVAWVAAAQGAAAALLVGLAGGLLLWLLSRAL